MKEGLQRKPTQNIIGSRFNMLTVIDRVRINGKMMCKCQCDCGKILNIRLAHLNEGQVSCGCYSSKILGDRKRKHGKRNTKIYHMWHSMKSRCFNPNNTAYKDYGGRGITVCEEWKNEFESFYKWATANGYDENAGFMQCTLDRIDVNGNYEPSNCRFVSMKEQCNNRRSSVILEYKGEKHTVSQWAEIIGVRSATLYGRIKKNWSIGEILGYEYKKAMRIENVT